MKRSLTTKDVKFDDDGEALDDGKNEFLWLDRYLESAPGTEQAARLLERALWERRR